MKFSSDKEKVIYYYERAKFCEKNGDKEGFAYFLKKAKEIMDKIEKKDE